MQHEQVNGCVVSVAHCTELAGWEMAGHMERWSDGRTQGWGGGYVGHNCCLSRRGQQSTAALGNYVTVNELTQDIILGPW